jgi:hypothetical protein
MAVDWEESCCPLFRSWGPNPTCLISVASSTDGEKEKPVGFSTMINCFVCSQDNEMNAHRSN